VILVTGSGVVLELRLNGALAFETADGSEQMTPGSERVARAIASLLNRNPDWVLMIAVRPKNQSAEAEQQALTRSFVLVNALRALTYRDDVAETIGWSALKGVRGALQPNGLGFLLLGQQSEPPRSTPSPATAPPPTLGTPPSLVPTPGLPPPVIPPPPNPAPAPTPSVAPPSRKGKP
jgi:hypothetical protein